MLVVRPPSGIVLVEEHIIGGLMLHRTPLAGGVSLVITLRAERQRGVDTIAVFMRHDGRSCRDSSGSCTGAIILKKCLLRKELRVGGLIMETRFLHEFGKKRGGVLESRIASPYPGANHVAPPAAKDENLFFCKSTRKLGIPS